MNFFKTRALNKHIKLLKKHTRGTLIRDDDILSNRQKDGLNDILEKLDGVNVSDPVRAQGILEKMIHEYDRMCPPQKFRIIREYAEIIVVALTVAFGIRALFIQPFKIPTSSMQPTLFGIHYVDKKVVPAIPQPFNYLLYSTLKAEAVTAQPGYLNGFYPQFSKMLIFPWTAFNIGNVRYDLPGEKNKVFEYCFLRNYPQNIYYPENYTLCDGWLSDGDHLFVNRLSYHFKEPRRGDIVVFATEGIRGDADGKPLTDIGYYYVKRLVGMPGDTLKIDQDMLYVKTKGSSKFIPVTDFGIYAFQRIFSQKGGYQGYIQTGRLGEGKEVVVPESSYFMLGDNSVWSADSRYWGFVPRRNIVGKASFVFWPVSRRWGTADTKPPINVKTTIGKNNYIEAMTQQ